MIDGQMSIYDILESYPYDELLNKLKKYGIDDLYMKKFSGKQENFDTIYEELIKNQNYDEYILVLYEELKKYIKPVPDARNLDLWKKEQLSMDISPFRFGHNHLTILIPKDEKNILSVGPYFCLSMIPKRIFSRR